MDDREILRLLGDILKKLERIEKKVRADRWPEVNEIFASIRSQEEKLTDPKNDIPARLASDPAFSSRYLELKEKAEARIRDVTRAIESWKETQLLRIAQSRNLTDALNRYSRPPDTSFFVDKKE